MYITLKMQSFKVKKKHRSVESLINVSESECEFINSVKRNTYSGSELSSQCGTSNINDKPEGSDPLIKDHKYHKKKKHTQLKIKNSDKFSCEKDKLASDNSFKNLNVLQSPTNDERRDLRNVVNVISHYVKDNNASTKSRRFSYKFDIKSISPKEKKKKHKEKAHNFENNIIEDSNGEDKQPGIVNFDEHKVSKPLVSVNISESECELIDSVNLSSKKKKSNTHIDNNVISDVANNGENVCDKKCKKEHSKNCKFNLNNENKSLQNEYILVTVTPTGIKKHVADNSNSENLDPSTSPEIIEIVNSSPKKKKKRRSETELNTSDVLTKKHKRESEIFELREEDGIQTENNVTTCVGSHYVENICPEKCKKKQKHSKKCKLYLSDETKSFENEYISLTVTPTGIKKHAAENLNSKNLELSTNVSKTSSEIIEIVSSSPKKKKKQRSETELNTSDVPTRKHKSESEIFEIIENDSIQTENNVTTSIGSHYVENICPEKCKRKQKHSKKCKLYLSDEKKAVENEYISLTVTPTETKKHAADNSKSKNHDLSFNVSGSSCEIIDVDSSKKKKKHRVSTELDISDISTKKHKREKSTETNTSLINLHNESELCKVGKEEYKPLNSIQSTSENFSDNISANNNYNFSVPSTSSSINEKVEDSGHESYSSNLDNDPLSDNSDFACRKWKSKKHNKSYIQDHSTANNSLVTENCEITKSKSFIGKADLNPVTETPKQSSKTKERNQELINMDKEVEENTSNILESLNLKMVNTSNDEMSSPEKEKSFEKNNRISVLESLRIKEEPSIAEMSTDPNECEEENEKLLRLDVMFPFPICRLHNILTRTTRPTKEQLQIIKDLNLPVKNGLFSKQEDDKMLENWKELCRTHDLKLCPSVFIKFPKGMRRETQVDILRYIGHGLDNRMLERIYIRFKHLLQKNCMNLGRYTPEEDRLILEFMEETNSSRPFSDLSKLLNRSSTSVEKRYDLLTSTKRDIIHWTPEKVDKLVKAIMKITKCDKLEDLKDREFTTKEWRKLSKKTDDIPLRKLQRAWKVTIHPRLFSKEKDLRPMKVELINMLYKRKETDWRTVNWKEVAKNFEGFTAEKIYMMFKRLVYIFVPASKQKNLGESVDFLKNTFLRYEEVGKTYFQNYVFENGCITVR